MRSRPTRTGLALAIGLVAWVWSFTGVAAPRSAEPDLTQLYADHATAIVVVRSLWEENGSTTADFGGGAILGDGRILTACHILRRGPDQRLEADTVEVIVGAREAGSAAVRSDRVVPAKILRCDRERDLALLRVSQDLPKTRLRIARKTTVGAAIAALGHTPRGLTWTIHACRVAGRGYATDLKADAVSVGTDPEHNPDLEIGVLEVGCDSHPISGSVALDKRGRILGVHVISRSSSRNESAEHDHFYVAADEIRAFLAR